VLVEGEADEPLDDEEHAPSAIDEMRTSAARSVIWR